ncbi:hypothetical protein BA190_27535 [Labrys sp. WJW]|uniref:hypothetical protein n=1 Tax=Labrys sp. WJW TaxID=1737983 RepID=UPI00082F0756|nr:hypothetical protein [Labrys sp. WJW]OCC01717.1 hypothetical protein BA190_27535 [Labrys sp. WJW]
MIPSWPATLPQLFNRQGFAYAEGDGRLMSDTDTGPGKVRRRTTAAVDIMKGQMTVTLDQLQTMRDFIRNDLVGGSLPFQIADPLGGAAPLLVRFSKDGMPQYQNIAGALWTAAFQVDVLP